MDELDQAVGKAAGNHPQARLLMTQPGVGPITSLAFVLTIGDVSRFKHSKQISSYPGLIPRERSLRGKRGWVERTQTIQAGAQDAADRAPAQAKFVADAPAIPAQRTKSKNFFNKDEGGVAVRCPAASCDPSTRPTRARDTGASI